MIFCSSGRRLAKETGTIKHHGSYILDDPNRRIDSYFDSWFWQSELSNVQGGSCLFFGRYFHIHLKHIFLESFFGMYQIDMSSESILKKKNICKRISASTFITALHQTHIHWSQIQHLDWLHFSHIYLIDLAYLFIPDMHAKTVCWFMFVLFFFQHNFWFWFHNSGFDWMP